VADKGSVTVAQRSKSLGAPSREAILGTARGSHGFKVSAAASVVASVLRTEVSTVHPQPVTPTIFRKALTLLWVLFYITKNLTVYP